MSAENTELKEVLPGDRTGVYYITICNLAFGVHDQELKDWIHKKVDCQVDHVEIFSGSTSGWVRLKGKANFEKAWGVLDNGIFKGLPIIADDKNRTQTIVVKMKKGVEGDQADQAGREMLPPPVIAYSQPPGQRPPVQGQQGAAASSATSTQYPSAPGQYYAAGYNQAGGPSYSGQSMPAQGYPSQPPAMTDPREYYNYGGANAGPSSGVGYSPSYQYGDTQFALPYRGQQEAPAYYPGAGAAAGGSVPGQEPAYQAETEYLATEARKLHVSPFPQHARVEDVKRWVMHKIYEKQTVQDIDVPMNRSGKYIRGHIFVVFDSAASATKGMELLNKARYQGDKVKARPTVEGVTEGEATMSFQAPNKVDLAPARIPTGPRGDKSQRPRHRESYMGPSPEKKRSSEKKPSDKKPSDKKPSDKKSSSSAKKSSKTSSKKTLPDKKGSSSTKDAGPPLVVDGSSRRFDKR